MFVAPWATRTTRSIARSKYQAASGSEAVKASRSWVSRSGSEGGVRCRMGRSSFATPRSAGLALGPGGDADAAPAVARRAARGGSLLPDAELPVALAEARAVGVGLPAGDDEVDLVALAAVVGLD